MLGLEEGDLKWEGGAFISCHFYLGFRLQHNGARGVVVTGFEHGVVWRLGYINLRRSPRPLIDNKQRVADFMTALARESTQYVFIQVPDSKTPRPSSTHDLSTCTGPVLVVGCQSSMSASEVF